MAVIKKGEPGDEIEITPAMIEAGVAEFCSYDPRIENPKEIVMDIFKAMTVAEMTGNSSSKIFDVVSDADVWMHFVNEMDQKDANDCNK